MNQVHKENLTSVENALPNRQGLDIEIFGMEGVPDDIVQQHNQRIIQNFYTAQAERQAATGNPPRGQSGGQGPAKKIKYETPEELKKRLAEHRAKLAAQKAAGANGVPPAAAPVDGQSPAQGVRFTLPYSHHPNHCSLTLPLDLPIPSPTTRLPLRRPRRPRRPSLPRDANLPADRRRLPTRSLPAAGHDSALPAARQTPQRCRCSPRRSAALLLQRRAGVSWCRWRSVDGGRVGGERGETGCRWR
jgi:hypothetical protein